MVEQVLQKKNTYSAVLPVLSLACRQHSNLIKVLLPFNLVKKHHSEVITFWLEWWREISGGGSEVK